MALKENDFIELEFTARVKDGEVFDTNIEAEAKKAGLNIKEFNPLIVSIGSGMLIKGLDESIKGKETGKSYKEEFKPEKAFGDRDSKLVKMIPLKAFHQHKIQPQKGMQLNLDGNIAKILAVSGGRVLTDLNNPLAGKIVEYEYTIKSKVENQDKKINALQDFFFRKQFPFITNKEKDTIIFTVPKGYDQFLKMFEEHFNKILKMKIDFKIEEPKKQEKKEQEKTSKKD